MITVLVTGATGALGRAMVAYLKQNGNYRVIATSRYCEDSRFRLDVTNIEQINAVMKNYEPDLVLHLAATFVNNFDEAYRINVESTKNLLNVIENSDHKTRVLLIGSASEYGLVHPKENPISEDHILNPVSIYGLTKAWQTQLAILYANRGVDVLVARVFNLEGKGLSEQLFVGRLQKQIDEVIAKKKSFIEVGRLTAIRDYILTDEASNQILAIATYGESGRVYHVASGTPVCIRDVLLRYLSTHNLDISIVHEAKNLSTHIGYDVPEIYADITSTLQLMQIKKVI